MQCGMTVERIEADCKFHESLLQDVKHFFTYGILPELIGKWYTRIPIGNTSGVVPTSAKSDEMAKITKRYGATAMNQAMV